MKTQKALYLKEKKGPFVIDTREIQKPEAGEILIKIKATGLNPADWLIQALGVVIEDYPAILGMDIAGDVEEIGEGVEGFVKGERVFLSGMWKNEFSGYQQYTRCPAELAAKIPSAFSYAQMASIPLTFATAAIPLFSENGAALNPTFDPSVKYTGQTALVVGGSASVGQYAIQLLRFAGFSTIITYASGQHTEYLKSLGATHVIDRKLVEITDLPSEVNKITNGKAVQLVHAAISQPETLAAGVAVLADDAPLVTVLPPGIPTPPALEAVEKRGKLFKVYADVYQMNRPFGTLIYKNFTRWLEEGTFVPNRIEELPNGLAGVVAGLERMKNNQISGVKLVINPQETPWNL
ncbi:GroES-like protein [Moniliophthora roreri MCA 2997]|uniref:GroES-like protein n=2 Tax=Moniliophthora roreri TaxID=221103 RepID=V2XJ74_MONRO|nr:GroES-like protein [Moniliophthora roreri MCA 2997]